MAKSLSANQKAQKKYQEEKQKNKGTSYIYGKGTTFINSPNKGTSSIFGSGVKGKSSKKSSVGTSFIYGSVDGKPNKGVGSKRFAEGREFHENVKKDKKNEDQYNYVRDDQYNRRRNASENQLKMITNAYDKEFSRKKKRLDRVR